MYGNVTNERYIRTEGVGAMARARSPNRDKAQKMYLEAGGDIKLKDIAAKLGVSAGQIRKWKSTDKWDESLKKIPKTFKQLPAKSSKGNVTNESASKSVPNTKAVKHGLFSRYLPEEVYTIVEELKETDIGPMEVLYSNILLQHANILKAQKILYVENPDDIDDAIEMESCGDSGDITKKKIMYAWEKQATAMKAVSKAMSTLNNMIKQYKEMLDDVVSDRRVELQTRIKKLELEIDNMEASKTDNVVNYYSNIPQPDYDVVDIEDIEEGE